MQSTFAVADVKLGQQNKYPAKQEELLKALCRTEIEACSKPNKPLLYTSDNQFVAAVGISFAEHYPLSLSPDALWLILAQGLALHIDKNSEKVRKRFVSHEGKVEIEVRRDEFVRGSPNNNWPNAFDEFSVKIESHIGKDNHKNIVADFTTTGPIEKAASEVVLMDAMKNYFSYKMITLCGIPSITLEGKTEDWESIRDKVNGWKDLGLEWWLNPLKAVLDQFVEATKGNIDLEWWNSFYKEHSEMMSGAETKISGWINWLFPYLNKGYQNTYVGKMDLEKGDGLTDGEFPCSLSKVPFTWNYYGQNFKYEFLAGLTGVTQDPDTLTVSPIAGWAVRDTSKPRFV